MAHELGREPQHDVLIVIAEPAAEDVDAAGMARVRLDLDLKSNRMVSREVEVLRRQRRDPDAVDERAVGRHPEALQHAVLAAPELPPVGRVKPPVIAEIAGAGPAAKLPAVDRNRDVGRPVGRGAGRLGGEFERTFERRDGLADMPGVIGKLIFDKAAREPDEARIHSVGIEEGPRHVEETNDPLRRAEAAGGAHFAAGIEPDRHRDLDGVGVDADIVAEHHENFVERREAELLMPFPPFMGFRPDESGALEDLQIGRDRRLRKAQRLGDVVDIDTRATMQQAQNSRPRRRGQPAQYVRPLRGIDHQEIARHSRPRLRFRLLYQLFGYFGNPRRRLRGAAGAKDLNPFRRRSALLRPHIRRDGDQC